MMVLGYSYIEVEMNEWGNLEFTKKFVEIVSEDFTEDELDTQE
jgi:hypothetical protein